MKTATVIRRAPMPAPTSHLWVPATVLVTKDDLVRVIELAAPRTCRFPSPAFPLLFSCSVNGIWPRYSNKHADRYYVDGQSWLLDLARDIALQCRQTRRGAGGVIRVHIEGVDLYATGARILSFRRQMESRVR